jgi:predicted ribonuclease YlaK
MPAAKKIKQHPEDIQKQRDEEIKSQREDAHHQGTARPVASGHDSKRRKARDPVFVVIDTNTLIQHLADLLNFKHHEHITIVLPLIVVHELDGLKKEDGQTGFRARTAIKALSDALQENQMRVKKWMRGQSSFEVIQDLPNRNNDDSILNCAQYYNKFVAPNKTILLTNDTALSVKAMMNSIVVMNVQRFLEDLPPVYSTHSNVLNAKMKHAPPSLEQINSTATKQEQSLEECVAELPGHLPVDLWRYILGHLPVRNLPVASRVCTAFYKMINMNDVVWRLSIRNTFKDFNSVLVPKGANAKEWYVKWRRSTLTLNPL